VEVLLSIVLVLAVKDDPALLTGQHRDGNRLAVIAAGLLHHLTESRNFHGNPSQAKSIDYPNGYASQHGEPLDTPPGIAGLGRESLIIEHEILAGGSLGRTASFGCGVNSPVCAQIRRPAPKFTYLRRNPPSCAQIHGPAPKFATLRRRSPSCAEIQRSAP
jgi:hypothetical protein